MFLKNHHAYYPYKSKHMTLLLVQWKDKNQAKIIIKDLAYKNAYHMPCSLVLGHFSLYHFPLTLYNHLCLVSQKNVVSIFVGFNFSLKITNNFDKHKSNEAGDCIL